VSSDRLRDRLHIAGSGNRAEEEQVIDPFVLGHLRENPLHASAKVFATALEISLLLACVGINRGIGPNPTIQRLNFGIFVSILLLFAFAVSFLFLTIARY